MKKITIRSPRIRLEPLGDQAVLVTLPDEETARRFALAVRDVHAPWLIDVVQAYISVAVFYDLESTTYKSVAESLMKIRPQKKLPPGTLHVIPCCYELGPDLQQVAELTKLPTEEVIRLHSSTEYTVYAIGFCPGFPYLGYLPETLCGVPRLETPRLQVEPGSVGLTGKQTGIYPLPRPGGWRLIGRTPLEIVHVEGGYFPIRGGDRIQFNRIDEAEFQRLKGQRLSV